jgi:hypothetical protein
MISCLIENLSGKDHILHVTLPVRCHNLYTLLYLPLRLRPLLLVTHRLRDVQAQTVRVEIHLIVRVLQDLRNVPCVLELPQIDVRPALLDGVSDELGGAGFTLGADDGGLLLLAGFVDDEGGSLGFLLGDLLGFDGGGEFGGEGEVLGVLARHILR